MAPAHAAGAAHAAAHAAAPAGRAVVGLLHVALHRASVRHRHVAASVADAACASRMRLRGWLEPASGSNRLDCRRLAERFVGGSPAPATSSLLITRSTPATLAGDPLGDLLLLVAGDGAHEPRDAVLVLDADAVVLELAAVFHVLGDLLGGGAIVLGVGRGATRRHERQRRRSQGKESLLACSPSWASRRWRGGRASGRPAGRP